MPSDTTRPDQAATCARQLPDGLSRTCDCGENARFLAELRAISGVPDPAKIRRLSAADVRSLDEEAQRW